MRTYLKLIAWAVGGGLIIGFIDNLTDRNLAAILGVSLILGGLILVSRKG